MKYWFYSFMWAFAILLVVTVVVVAVKDLSDCRVLTLPQIDATATRLAAPFFVTPGA